ncbi:hypothetical protein NDS46_30470 (plasmid) [Paenibacillus thiaminolyticus]|uniref:hypothetical protein n=1 Tax=Paenibacillus thiaminolyticus TaxID=49283 RepID=UPI0023315B26|nr:hypothetical protein [Paenibacillus thiaminolyticus]WCF11674.1 hypothetical protein NDS46_30470 [Paenibacillus thiaminolyticus]
MKNKLYRNIWTNEVWTCKDFGKLVFEEAWKEQKLAGSIPEDSADYDRPSVLNDEEYIEIGEDALRNNEDYEEVQDRRKK